MVRQGFAMPGRRLRCVSDTLSKTLKHDTLCILFPLEITTLLVDAFRTHYAGAAATTRKGCWKA
jgi:hypothetical protein